MSATDNLQEADRLMTICNSCRYCEGLCAVFPAMEMRPTFKRGDLNLLANLCHNCGACFDACQFAPPHEFKVNVPRALAKLRRDSWEAYVWPRAFAGVMRRNAAAVMFGSAAIVALFLAAVATFSGRSTLLATHTGAGAFYRIVPHEVMASLFGAVFLYAVIALFMGLRAFWRDVSRDRPLPADAPSIWQALRDAGSLRYLDGGGAGCADETKSPKDSRRLFHHLTFYGFLLCFAATCAGTVYHYVAGRHAPYAWWEPPVILGVAGGVGLVVGPLGLLMARRRRRPELSDSAQGASDTAFTLLLLTTSFTGLALLAFRATPAMGLLLATHLGFVCAFFLAMPYSRFVHGLYRFAALVRYAQEMRRAAAK